MKQAFLALGLFIAISNTSTAQEQLFPLMGNLELLKQRELPEEYFEQRRALRAGGASLPFFDDFSEPFNKLPYPGGYWPDQAKWTDLQAFINDNLPIDPISVGVATLDGVNEIGQPYNWGVGNIALHADSLTSIPIDLSNTAGDVMLSFYYQAGGRGYSPEAADSLVVEFKAPGDTSAVWSTVWNTEGTVSDSSWHLVGIPIENEIFLHDSFQFRFRNYASLHSNGDFWHIDYVLLDDERPELDTTFFDVSILERTHSFLKDYEAMPWTHFKTDPVAFMNDSNVFRLRNNYNDQLSPQHLFRVMNSQGDYISGPPFLSDFFLNPETVCTNAIINDCGPDNITFGTENFIYPTNVEVSPTSNFFEIRNIIRELNDDVPSNDSVVYVQEFENFYAYDDGTAEVAYGLGFIEEPGRVAVRYDVAMTDVLRGVQMYWDPIRWNLSEEQFQIEVWQGNDEPEELVFATDTIFPVYTGTDVFYHYVFDEPVNVTAGPIYIGWTQPANVETNFTVGFDLSFDASSKVFYNLSNDWVQSSIPGAVMFRPMFGDPIDTTPNSINEENDKPGFGLYPNPTSDILNVEALSIGTVTILDMTGRKVLDSQVGIIDVSALEAGVYLVSLTEGAGGDLGVKRFIKQ